MKESELRKPPRGVYIVKSFFAIMSASIAREALVRTTDSMWQAVAFMIIVVMGYVFIDSLIKAGSPENQPDPEKTTAPEARTATNERTSDV